MSASPTAVVAATGIKMSEFDEPLPDTLLYRNDSLSVAQRDASRRSLADLMNPTAEVEAVEALTSPTAEPSAAVETATKLGWFNGVMVPCLLNIWGVIMFLRLTWVVGQAGIILAVAIITLSNIVTTITALSLFAIVTNGEVKGGGAYFLISRALGPTYGGVIGLLFFCAQAVATSMYVIGFSDSIIDIMKKGDATPFTGDFANDQRVISTITMVLLLGTAYGGGASVYAKAMIYLLVVLVLSLISLFVGAFLPAVPDLVKNVGYGFVGFSRVIPDEFLAKLANGTAFTPDENSVWMPNFTTDPTTMMSHSFFSVFAVFFPAVTGIMAGANMSGDLKEPGYAIPTGTVRAIVLTYISYCILAMIAGLVCLRCSDLPENVGRCPSGGLADPTWAANAVANNEIPQGGMLYSKMIVESISVWGPLVYAGVFAATLSSALASIVGAPRILQSVAADEIFPWPVLTYFAKGSGPGNEPLRGYVLSFVVGLGCCLVGQLDVIAPIISNFFMISYGVTNYACFAASYSESPGWRPSFKYYNKWLSLFGAVLCVVVMFLMDWVNSLLSGSIGICIFLYLQHLDPETHWGPAGEARKYVAAVRSMETLQGIKRDHVKTYRPQFLVMCGTPTDRMSLIKFATMMRAGHGVNVYGSVIVEPTVDPEKIDSERIKMKRDQMAIVEESRKSMYAFFYENPEFLRESGVEAKIRAFCDVVSAPNVHEGFLHLLQLGGLGRLRPNVVLMGFKKDWMTASAKSVSEHENIIADAMYHKRGLLVLRDRKNVLNNHGIVNKEKLGTKSSPSTTTEPKTSDDTEGGTVQIEQELSIIDVSTGANNASTHRSEIFELKKKKKVGTKRIDIWYLGDDGGLTVLLPYLMQKDSRWTDAELRVCNLTHSSVEGGQTARLTYTTSRMLHLLKKFRILSATNVVDARLSTWPMEKTMQEYRRICKQSGCKCVLPNSRGDSAEAPSIKALRILRFAEVLRTESRDADMVFIQLPVPEKDMSTKEYTSYLEILSSQMPMTCFIRGNNENVMTIYA